MSFTWLHRSRKRYPASTQESAKRRRRGARSRPGVELLEQRCRQFADPLADAILTHGEQVQAGNDGILHQAGRLTFRGRNLDQEVGIVGVPGYWRFPEAFMGSRWIWTISLVFDNTVLLRKTVRYLR